MAGSGLTSIRSDNGPSPTVRQITHRLGASSGTEDTSDCAVTSERAAAHVAESESRGRASEEPTGGHRHALTCGIASDRNLTISVTGRTLNGLVRGHVSKMSVPRLALVRSEGPPIRPRDLRGWSFQPPLRGHEGRGLQETR